MFRTFAAVMATGTCIVAFATPAAAQTRGYNIPGGSLKVALDAYVRQSGRQIVYRADEVRSARSPGVRGQHSADAALAILLAGSGFTTRVDGSLVAIVRSSGNAAVVGSKPGESLETQAGIVDISPDILVTGSRIRGGNTPSPVLNITAERIREEGFADLGEVIRSVPQNFSGGQNPGVINGGAASLSNQNLTGGSGLNLRGLGPDATLTLLNGRRLSYGGFVQAVDISAIPIEAVERFEIVPDGASAIYGSDAVGGVGHVILKRDYDRITIGARYGAATDGGLETREYSATAGTTWNNGGLIATYIDVSADPIYADERSFTRNMNDPYTIYSGNHLKSGLLSLHQSLGDRVEFRLDALRTERDRTHYEGYSGFYALAIPETTTWLIAPSLEIAMPKDWSLSVGGSWGRDETRYSTQIIFPTSVSSRETFYGNESQVYEASAEGPLFALPGGDARLAIGAGYRKNQFLQRNAISGIASVDDGESSRFAYAEINLPLIGPAQNMAGIGKLALTGAVRGEKYDSFGSVVTPKFGLVYDPSADFTIKASWGKSFKAPTLNQLGQTRSAYLYSTRSLGGTGYAGDATVLMTYGGNPDLGPERAETTSATLAFHPRRLSGLELELTAFDIDYTDRVELPLNIPQALSSPVYAQFIDYDPSSGDLAGIISDYTFYNYAGAQYDAGKVVAIARNQYTNVSRQQIRGLDLSGAYRFDFAAGSLTLRGAASWLHRSQQLTQAQRAYDLAGTLFYPARIKGRLGVVWSGGGFSASSFANHTGGVTDTMTERKSGSFTTFDATLRYQTGNSGGVLSGLRFDLSVQNLFDQAPPSYRPTDPNAARYDSTNYSAIGRFLSVSVSKHW